MLLSRDRQAVTPDRNQIGNRPLFVGSFAGAVTETDPFANILNVSDTPTPSNNTQQRGPQVHQQPIDNTGTDTSRFAAAVSAARRLYDSKNPLLIHCEAGVNRSVTVAATLIAAEENRQLEDALTIVCQSRPTAQPNGDLVETAQAYLNRL